MNKLKLIHKKDVFWLEINDKRIEMVQEYGINAKSEDRGIYELSIKIPIDIQRSSIDIES